MVLGKSIHDLHLRIVGTIKAEARSKQKDYTGRLQRELTFTQYINPIAILCLEVYKLDIPQLRTLEAQELTAAGGLASDRDYKKVVFAGSRITKSALDSFLKPFIDAFISKYCA